MPFDFNSYSNIQRIRGKIRLSDGLCCRYYSSLFNRKPYLRYIWVGPPHDNNMDIESVLEMAEQTDNPVEYYCLNENMDYYARVFHRTKVNVKSIQASVEKLVVNPCR